MFSLFESGDMLSYCSSEQPSNCSKINLVIIAEGIRPELFALQALGIRICINLFGGLENISNSIFQSRGEKERPENHYI